MTSLPLLLRAVGSGAVFGAFEAARNGLLAPADWIGSVAIHAAVLGAAGFACALTLSRFRGFRPGLHRARSAELAALGLGSLLGLLVEHVHVAGRLGRPQLLVAGLLLLLSFPVLLWVPRRAYVVVLGIAGVAMLAYGTARMTVAIGEDRRLDAVAESTAARDMNVIVILVDSLRPDHLGINGYPRELSPTMDRLAAEGRRFTRATNPGTVANWASLHASAYPSSHYRDLGPSELANLSELFRQNGWNTFGLTSHWPADAESGFARGLDCFRPARRASLGRLAIGYAYARLMSVLGRAGRLGGEFWYYPADRVVDDMIRITTSQKHENFLIWAHLVDPHVPYQPGPGYADRFQTDPNRGYRRHADRIRGPDGAIIAERLENALARYDGAVRFVDDQLARLIAHLERQGTAEKTLIVLTADHGDAFGEHGLLVHPADEMYSEIVNVPLLFYWPGTLSPGRVEVPVTTLDILPTLAGLAGIPVPESAEGDDLTCLLRETDCAWEREWVFWDGTRLADGQGPMGVSSTRYRYWEPEGRPPELYDLLEDPGERVNLASTGLEIEARLARAVRIFREQRRRAAILSISR